MNFKFKLFDKISIIPLNNLSGTIINIWISNNEIQYKIRYFVDNEPKEIYFYEWEIELDEEKNTKIGFK